MPDPVYRRWETIAKYGPEACENLRQHVEPTLVCAPVVVRTCDPTVYADGSPAPCLTVEQEAMLTTPDVLAYTGASVGVELLAVVVLVTVGTLLTRLSRYGKVTRITKSGRPDKPNHETRQ